MMLTMYMSHTGDLYEEVDSFPLASSLSLSAFPLLSDSLESALVLSFCSDDLPSEFLEGLSPEDFEMPTISIGNSMNTG